MNIKITYNWLLEYLETDTTPYEIQKYLSLCGPGVERVEKIDDDYVFDIEVTTNRVDMASVFGIAQEAQAILPIFGKKAKIKVNPLEQYSFGSVNGGNELPLHVKILDKSLLNRFSTVVLSNVKIEPAPEIMKKRLQMCGIKSINNVIDISNYLMLSLGQPTHTFDYDGIGKATMIVRKSKKGEKIKTLDEKEFSLPGDDIVVEDGNGEIIDLCGIMGGLNSSIKPSTKNVVLFVQTYNKKKIRKTSMVTGQRTIAATYFEKGLDEERVEPTLSYGVELLEKYASGKVASPVYDIYEKPYKIKIINISQSDIERVMGIKIPEEQVVQILNNLGFQTHKRKDGPYQINVPSWRSCDIDIKEDVIEEVARVYGYHNLPNNLQPTIYIKQPKELEKFFSLQTKVKHFLKHLGLHEVMNYSMVSKNLLELVDLSPEKHLELQNTISEEIRYFRQSLMPSLVKNIKDNEGKKEVLKVFEIAKIYIPRENDLPNERYKLALVTNTNFYDLKGIVEALFAELNIQSYSFKNCSHHFLSPHVQGEIHLNETSVGAIGQLKPTYQHANEIKSEVFLAEFEFSVITDHYKLVKTYVPPAQYATVKLDLTLEVGGLTYDEMKNKALASSPLLKNVEYVNRYENNITLRLYFAREDKNLTESEAKNELEKIKKDM